VTQLGVKHPGEGCYARLDSAQIGKPLFAPVLNRFLEKTRFLETWQLPLNRGAHRFHRNQNVERENEMNHVTLINHGRCFRASLVALALIAFASIGHAQNANANAATFASKQHAEIQALLTAAAELTSYNTLGSETMIEHLVAWEQLWAEDAILVVNPTAETPIVREGREVIANFFTFTPVFRNNWICLTRSFRNTVEIHGNTAEVYLECLYMDQTMKVVFPRAFRGTVRKVGGKWLFWRMVSEDASARLFP
jgi:hypothetical protein